MKKKNLYLTLICLLLLKTVTAQISKEEFIKGQQDGYRFNTGTLQDILTNYLQVAAKNITTTNSSLQLKLNWFALNRMDSVQKYNNDNFLKTWRQRNGEFITSVGVDKNNNFNSFQFGVNYNFLDRRDGSKYTYDEVYSKPFHHEMIILLAAVDHAKPVVTVQLVDKITTWVATLYQNGQPVTDFKNKLDAALPGMLQHTSSDDAIVATLENQFKSDLADKKPLGSAMTQAIRGFADYVVVEILTVPLNAYIVGLGKTPLKYDNYVTPEQTADLVAFINQEVAQNAYFKDTLKLGAKTLTELNKSVVKDYESMVKFVGRQPLLTAGYLYSYGKGTLLSSHVGSINFLYGTGNLTTLKTGQIKASLTDTLNSNDPTGKLRNFKRNIVSLQVGYNQVLAMQKKVSVMELNGALELNSATSGYVSGTSRSKFYFDAYFRARLPSTPWLKFDLKWDPKDGNVLGFFDFTYNLDKP
ncbi:hypothetical protein IDJ77_01075 [Mucilaginibacter sp. ZT4R22]|uniref:Uncharacterized protein n=1 Tax=Mucilaginibacter pankratovii TaxID=2772110 RepID=A0ABR7WM58_9SPHI|nr:hypothetical protein [Mucilaginibacter pankratovii]MBD1362387.1 hypothetical protein [Mucilaginibacter pankratovii]